MPSCLPRGGFSFPEVLFAVVVLGIGFIMIAAIFPVAIQQSKMTQDESAGAGVARASVTEVDALQSSALPSPATGTNWPVTFMPTYNVNTGNVTVRPVENYTGTLTPAWFNVRGLQVRQDDPRYANVLLYRRAGSPALTNPLPSDWSGTAQIYLIQCICRGTERPFYSSTAVPQVKMNNLAVNVPARIVPEFDQYDYATDTTGTNTPGTPIASPPPNNYSAAGFGTYINPNNLSAHRVLVQLAFNYNGLGVNVIKVNVTFNNTAVATQSLPDAVAEGAYVVISDDSSPVAATHTNITGRIYRVGLRRQDLDSTGDGQHIFYELQPGNDSQSTAEDLATDMPAFCVGRERLPDGSFIGGSQDVSIYVTTIEVKP